MISVEEPNIRKRNKEENCLRNGQWSITSIINQIFKPLLVFKHTRNQIYNSFAAQTLTCGNKV